MSYIGVIKIYLNPWFGRDGRIRYYVNDWQDLLKPDIEAYCKFNCCPSDAIRYGKVWYDSDAHSHADGIPDNGLSRFIERTMDCTQYLGPNERSEHEYRQYDWTKLSERVPRDFKGDSEDPLLFPHRGVTVFHYNGRDFYVEHSYLMEQMESNAFAYYHTESGKVWFECDASDLWEFVLELVNDEIKADAVRAKTDYLFGSEASIFEMPGTAEPAPKKKPSKTEPKPSFRTPTAAEIEQCRIERIEAESRPRSRWNKRDIMDNCREAKVPEKALMVLDRMKLDDILNLFLIYNDTDMTGNCNNWEQQRHTRFYRLDMDAIRALNPTLDEFRKRSDSKCLTIC